MPKNPDSARYQSSARRGYATQSMDRARKLALDVAADQAGFASTQDYIWAVMTGQRAPAPGLEPLRQAAQKELDEKS